MKKYFMLLSMVLILTACSNSDVETMSRYGNTIQNFTVENHNEEPFTDEDMEGKVWVVDFIFTNCATVCPPMTANMTELAQTLEDEEVENYGLLSFTVDPSYDEPEVMREYMGYFDMPENTEWQFVGGYDDNYIRSLAEQNFKTMVAPPPKGSDQVLHSTSFYLVDQDGTIMKDYSGIDRGESGFPLREIVDDVKKLTES